ncbi:unnamed protein product [Larinioides sclopetarius]|uniref:Uncharacterized protein n=1 Tax=Larinioides sclopetarius TaxID=280406 RepID=A0AAV2AFC3_9ARAC
MALVRRKHGRIFEDDKYLQFSSLFFSVSPRDGSVDQGGAPNALFNHMIVASTPLMTGVSSAMQRERGKKRNQHRYKQKSIPRKNCCCHCQCISGLEMRVDS